MRVIGARSDAWLVARSIAFLRVSVGAVFLGFGVLKFFPGVSPAQRLVERTADILTFGILRGSVALVFVATLECVIGLCLVANRAVRVATYLLAVELVGILSPLVLVPGRMFHGPHGAPTLEGQYVLKDVIVLGAALVVVASARGARLAPSPTSATSPVRRRPEQHAARGCPAEFEIHDWACSSPIESARSDSSERVSSSSQRQLKELS